MPAFLTDAEHAAVAAAADRLIPADDVCPGGAAEVEGALEELDQLLEPHPDLKERFFRLRVVDDAVKFLK